MKTESITKKLISIIVCAIMLLGIAPLGAFAADPVATSTYYEIDETNKTIYIAKNTFVGDFLKRIDAGSSVKKVVDASDTFVYNGFITEDMKLDVGGTKYTLKYIKLYDMAEKLASIPGTEDMLLFHYDKDATGTLPENTYNAFSTTNVRASALKTYGLFDAVAGDQKEETADYAKVTRKFDADNTPYLEFEANTLRNAYFMTEAISATYQEMYPEYYVESEMKDVILTYTGATADTYTGSFAMGHYYVGDTASVEGDTASSETFLAFTNAKNVLTAVGDMFGIGGNKQIFLGGTHKSEITSGNDLRASCTTTTTEMTLTQYSKITDSGSQVETYVFKDGAAFKGKIKSGANTETDNRVYEMQTGCSVERIAKGTLGIGNNRSNESTLGTSTTAKIYNYTLYLAENLPTAACASVNLQTSNGDNNGYAVTYSGSAAIGNVPPGFTAKDLIDSLIHPAYSNAYVVMDGAGNKDDFGQIAPDDKVLVDGWKLFVVKDSTGTSKGYTISLATLDDPTFDASTKTATRKFTNTKFWKFVFAGYNAQDELVEIKFADPNVAADGTRTATFTKDGIDHIKSFVFESIENLKPMTSQLTVSAGE